MVYRRQILASGGIFTSVSIAGCVNNPGPDGTNSIFKKEAPFSIPPSSNIISGSEIKSSNSVGRIRGSVTAYDNPKNKSITVIGNYRVLTNDSDWKHTRFHEIHDWSHFDKEMLTWDSNLKPTSEDRSAVVENLSASYKANWNIHLTPPHDSPTTYFFRSVYPVDDLTTGDLIVNLRTVVENTKENNISTDNNLIVAENTLKYRP